MSTAATHYMARHWRDYLAVTKPKVVLLLVFTAMVGMALAVPGIPPLDLVFFATLGIGLASASAAAINHVVDRRIDAQMHRTSNRPLPQGALSSRECVAFALGIGALAMLLLSVFVNPLTAWLTFASLIGYAVIYTMYLKRATPQNIVIGGAAGAMPPVLGWVAMTGELSAAALSLFLIVFLWTPPHFWALAIHRREEYAKVEMPMLPVTHGVAYTNLQILLYTVLMLIASLLPYLLGMNHWLYLIVALGLGARFLWLAAAMMRNRDDKLPMRLFVYSINYLMILFAAMLIDHYLL